MTKREALAEFQTVADEVHRRHGRDVVAMRTAWNDFVDGLQKAGRVTERQASAWVNPFDK